MQTGNEIVIYKSDDGSTSFDVRLTEETVWLNLMQLAELFQCDKSVISRHISNIYKEKELHQSSTVAKFATVKLVCRNYRHTLFGLMPRKWEIVSSILEHTALDGTTPKRNIVNRIYSII